MPDRRHRHWGALHRDESEWAIGLLPRMYLGRQHNDRAGNMQPGMQMAGRSQGVSHRGQANTDCGEKGPLSGFKLAKANN